jgi:hypothetical protein
MDWISLAQDRHRWRNVVVTITNLCDAQKAGIIAVIEQLPYSAPWSWQSLVATQSEVFAVS